MVIENYGVWEVDTLPRPSCIRLHGRGHGTATLEEFLAGRGQDILTWSLDEAMHVARTLAYVQAGEVTGTHGGPSCRCTETVPRDRDFDPRYDAEEAALFEPLDTDALYYQSVEPFKDELSRIRLVRCRACGANWYVLEQHREGSQAAYEKRRLVPGFTMVLPKKAA